MLCNSVSGPEIGLPGRTLAELLPGKHRPAEGPEALLRNIEYVKALTCECKGNVKSLAFRFLAKPAKSLRP